MSNGCKYCFLEFSNELLIVRCSSVIIRKLLFQQKFLHFFTFDIEASHLLIKIVLLLN